MGTVSSFALSVLIPVRTDDFEFYRKRLALRTALDLTGIETIIIDDGCPLAVAYEMEAFCAENAYIYIRLETMEQPFSLARSRNAALIVASSSSVYMDDADLVYPHDFFQRVVAQLELLSVTPFNFLNIPAVYLTEKASAKILSDANLDTSYLQVVHALILEDPKGSPANVVVESYAPASGAIALSRELALRIGGYDESFSGWGGEDRDFIFRLLCVNNKIVLPTHFNETKSWNLNDTISYEGWRALLRVHGEFMARQGMYAVHLYHKKLPWRRTAFSDYNFHFAAKKALAVQVETLPMTGRVDLRHSVLFCVYKAHDLFGATVSSRKMMRRIKEGSKLKNSVQVNVNPLHRKLRKLFMSLMVFLGDLRFGLLRALAHFFSKSK